MPILHWIGKDKVVNHHHDVPFRLLKKDYTFKANENTQKNSTANRIIHGDNLEALKSLLPEFEGKINCIYIDPPYNTGNEGWVYNDNVNDPKIKKWLGEVVGKEGEDLSRHDKWLCMIYPRLKLLHRLLSDDGVIFISIDDNEQANLKLIMDEIFGLNNFITSVIWQKKKGGGNDSKFIAVEHEYIIVYAKAKSHLDNWYVPYDDSYLKRYKEEDENGKYFWDTFMRASGKQYYPILCPDGSSLEYDKNGNKLSWLRSEPRFKQDLENGAVRIIKVNGEWTVHFKQYLSSGKKPRSILSDISNNSNAKEELLNIFNNEKVFDYSKPTDLISNFIQIITNKDSIILDSFAGSGTTAHAVLKLNAEDGGSRQFICIEMMDYAETITAERVKRVMNGYGDDKKSVEGLGGGFDFYTVDAPLFLEDNNLNEEVGEKTIRNYVAYSENISSNQNADKNNAISPYTLGVNDDALYVFYYQKDKITTLDMDFLASLKIGELPKRPSNFIIYADKCVLEKEFMLKHNITFKRIPRDITRF